MTRKDEENISRYTKIINDFALKNDWLKLIHADESEDLDSPQRAKTGTNRSPRQGRAAYLYLWRKQ